MANAGNGMPSRSHRGHHHRERHFDELLILVDGVQGAANIVGDVGATVLFYPFGRSMMAASRASWFSLSLKSREGSKSEFGMGFPLRRKSA